MFNQGADANADLNMKERVPAIALHFLQNVKLKYNNFQADLL